MYTQNNWKTKITCNYFFSSFCVMQKLFLPLNIVGGRDSALQQKWRPWKSLNLELPIHHFVSHSCARSVWTPSSKCNSFRLAVFYSWVPLSAPLSSRGTAAPGGCRACGTIRNLYNLYIYIYFKLLELDYVAYCGGYFNLRKVDSTVDLQDI